MKEVEREISKGKEKKKRDLQTSSTIHARGRGERNGGGKKKEKRRKMYRREKNNSHMKKD